MSQLINTGYVVALDEQMRLPILTQAINQLNIHLDDEYSCYFDGEYIVFSRQLDENECIFCSNTKNLTEYKNQYICSDCLSLLD